MSSASLGDRSTVAPAPRAATRTRRVALALLNNSVLIALLVEIAIFAVLSPRLFFSLPNALNVLRLASLGGIVVACYTCAMIAGQIDLSTSYVGGLAAVVFAVLVQVAAWPFAAALAAALVLAAAIGLLNSFLITRIGIPSLIATLAIGTLCFGLAFLAVDVWGQSGSIRLGPPVRSAVTRAPGGIPLTIYLMLATYLVLALVLAHTKLGAHLYALGGNAQVAHLNGIHSTGLIRFVLVLTAVSSAVAAIFLSGRQLAAGPAISVLGAASSGSLAAPASPLVAALFAGVALNGGSGRVERTLLGVLFLAVLAIGLAIVNAPVYVRTAVEGLAFVCAILLDSVRERLETR